MGFAAGKKGFTIQIGNSGINMADGLTYYLSRMFGAAPSTSLVYPWYLPLNATLKKAIVIVNSGVAGSAEDVNVYFYNNGVSTLIEANPMNSTSVIFINENMSVSVLKETLFSIKIVCPTWITNPTSSVWGAVLYFE